MTLAHRATGAGSGTVGAGVEALEAAVEGDGQVLEGSVRVGREAGDVRHGQAGAGGVLHDGLLNGGGCRCGGVPADTGQLDWAARGGGGDDRSLGNGLGGSLDRLGGGGLGLLLGLVLVGLGGRLLGGGLVGLLGGGVLALGGGLLLVVLGGGLVGADLGGQLGGLRAAGGGGLLAGADLGGQDLDPVGQGAEGVQVLVREGAVGVQGLEGVNGLGAHLSESVVGQVGQVLGDLQVEGLDRSVLALVGEDGDVEVLAHVEGSSVF